MRVRDESLGISQSSGCIRWLFDLQLNDKLAHNSSQLVSKKVFEHLTENRVTGQEINESNIDYDRHDTSGKIKELGALIKHKS